MADIELKGEVRRAVLVGTARGPLDIIKTKDGLEIRDMGRNGLPAGWRRRL